MKVFNKLHKFDGGHIETISCGKLDNLQYFIVDQKTNCVAAVDPAWEIDEIDAYIQKNNWQLESVLLTHTHYDHIDGLNDLVKRYPNIWVYLSKEEQVFCRTSLPKKVRACANGQIISVGQSFVKVLHAFGHTPGSVCYLIDGYLISGDTIFIFGCGRCNLPGGDAKVLFSTLQELSDKLPNSTVILPGHNYGASLFSTMNEQIKGNPFFMLKDLDVFVWYRNHGHNRRPPYQALDQQAIQKIKKEYSSVLGD